MTSSDGEWAVNSSQEDRWMKEAITIRCYTIQGCIRCSQSLREEGLDQAGHGFLEEVTNKLFLKIK